MNALRTTGLMAAMIALFLVIGQLLGGPRGMMLAFVVAVGMNVASYWFSSSIVLRMYDAKEVDRSTHPDLIASVDRLRKRANLPMPQVCVIPSDQPNAFATGRNPDNAVVAVTEGLMRTLNREELEGVIAHELAHVKNRDMLTSTIAATLAGAVTLLARFGIFFDRDDNGMVTSLLMLILAPLAAMLIQMAISRSREYAADRDGAEIAGSPHGLANALRQMQAAAEQRPMRASGTASNATSHMFIVNPFSGALSGVRKLFSTHPPAEERIQRLEQMA